MITTTYIWEYTPEGVDYAIKRELEKKFGSKRSGTIYIVAENIGEATEIVRELYSQVGKVPPERIQVSPTHLVRQALKMIY